MKGYYSFVQAISGVGVLVSIVMLFINPLIGALLLLFNLCALSSCGKELKKIQDKEEKRRQDRK